MMECNEEGQDEFDIYSDLITDFDVKSITSNSQAPSVCESLDQQSNCSDSEYRLTIVTESLDSQSQEIQETTAPKIDEGKIADPIEKDKKNIESKFNNVVQQLMVEDELYIDFIHNKHEERFKDVEEKLKAENTILQTTITKLRYENLKLGNELTVLKNNISALFKTADAEIKRKNYEIHELRQRLDSVLFRRQEGQFRRYNYTPESTRKRKYEPLTPPSSAEKSSYYLSKNLYASDEITTESVLCTKTISNPDREKAEPIVFSEQTPMDSIEMENSVERSIKTKTLWVTSKYLLKDENTSYEKKNLGKKGTRRLSEEKPNDEVRLLNYNLWKRKKESPVKLPILVPKLEMSLSGIEPIEDTIIIKTKNNVDKAQMVLKEKTNSQEEKVSVENPKTTPNKDNNDVNHSFKIVAANVEDFTSFKLKEDFKESKETAVKENVNISIGELAKNRPRLLDKGLGESPKKKVKLDQPKQVFPKKSFSPRKLNTAVFPNNFKIPKIPNINPLKDSASTYIEKTSSSLYNLIKDLNKTEGKLSQNENDIMEQKKRSSGGFQDQLKALRKENNKIMNAVPNCTVEEPHEFKDSKLSLKSKCKTLIESKLPKLPVLIESNTVDNLERIISQTKIEPSSLGKSSHKFNESGLRDRSYKSKELNENLPEKKKLELIFPDRKRSEPKLANVSSQRSSVKESYKIISEIKTPENKFSVANEYEQILKEIEDENFKPKEHEGEKVKEALSELDSSKFKGSRGKTKDSERNSSTHCKLKKIPVDKLSDKVSKEFFAKESNENQPRSKDVLSLTNCKHQESTSKQKRVSINYKSENDKVSKKNMKVIFESNENKAKSNVILPLTDCRPKESTHPHDKIFLSFKRNVPKSKNFSVRNLKPTDSNYKELEKNENKTIKNYSSPVPKENGPKFKDVLSPRRTTSNNNCNLKLSKKSVDKSIVKINTQKSKRADSNIQEMKKLREPFPKKSHSLREAVSTINNVDNILFANGKSEKPKLYSRNDSRSELRPKCSMPYKSISQASYKHKYPLSSRKDKFGERPVKPSREYRNRAYKFVKENHNTERKSSNRHNSFEPIKQKNNPEKTRKQSSEKVKKLDISNNVCLGNKKETLSSKTIEENLTDYILQNVNDATLSNTTNDKINNCKVNLPVSDSELEDGEILSDIEDYFIF